MVLGLDGESLGANVQGRGDVAMYERLRHLDLEAEDLQGAIGPDKPYDLDEPSPRQSGGQLEVVVRQARCEPKGALEFLGGGALEDRVAVVRVVTPGGTIWCRLLRNDVMSALIWSRNPGCPAHVNPLGRSEACLEERVWHETTDSRLGRSR